MIKIVLRNLLIFTIIIVLSGCYTSIRTITKHPDYYNLKKVKIRGRVVSSIELDDLNIFYLQNKKHTISVVTEGYLPLNNEFIIVRGRVYSNFKYHSKWKMQVIYEQIKIKNIRSKDAEYKYLNEKYFNSKDFK